MGDIGRTKIFKVDSETPDTEKIKEAAGILKNGGLVAFPTETVYGLAAIYNRKDAVDKLYEVKNRPKDKPFTLHISREEMIDMMGCEVPLLARKLIKKFWPGPLTIVLKRKDSDETLAFRMPDHKVARELIDEGGAPVVAPSANFSGERSPKTAGEVLENLEGKIHAVLDAGPSRIGTESTIIDASSFPCRILRHGAIPASSIKDAWEEDF